MDEPDIVETRRKRLNQLIAERYHDNRAEFCRKSGEDPTYLSRLFSDGKHSKAFTETIARRIEKEIGLKRGWLDRDARTDAQHDKKQAALGLTEEAIEMARVWMQLSPGRRAKHVDEIYRDAVVEKTAPWLRVGRPPGQAYLDFEAGALAERKAIIAQLQLEFEE